MIRMKFVIGMLIVALQMICLSGCWSKVELNELAVVTALGLDKTKSGYRVTLQIINPNEIAQKKQSSRGSSTAYTYSGIGQTVPDALGRLTTEIPRRLYLGHLRVLVLGESLAREGISASLDFFSRNRELRTDFYLLIARDSKAADVLKIFTTLDPIPANHLFASLTTSHQLWAATGKVTLDKMLQDMTSKGTNPVLTAVSLVGDPKTGKNLDILSEIEPSIIMRYTGMAVFKKDRLIGWIDEDGSKSFNYITNHINQTVGFVNCPQKGKISLGIVRSQSVIHADLNADKSPRFNVALRIESDISSAECQMDLSKPDAINVIEKLAEEKVAGFLKDSIHAVQQNFKVDIYGFGEALHRSHPRVWKQLQGNWNETFSSMDINVSVDFKIRRIGTINQPLKQEVNR